MCRSKGSPEAGFTGATERLVTLKMLEVAAQSFTVTVAPVERIHNTRVARVANILATIGIKV
jgi:hypothetical protein